MCLHSLVSNPIIIKALGNVIFKVKSSLSKLSLISLFLTWVSFYRVPRDPAMWEDSFQMKYNNLLQDHGSSTFYL